MKLSSRFCFFGNRYNPSGVMIRGQQQVVCAHAHARARTTSTPQSLGSMNPVGTASPGASGKTRRTAWAIRQGILHVMRAAGLRCVAP